MNAVQASLQAPLPKADRAPGQSTAEGREEGSGALPEWGAFAVLLTHIAGEAGPTASETVGPGKAPRDDANEAGPAQPAPVLAPVLAPVGDTARLTDIAALLANIVDLSLGLPVPPTGVSPPARLPAGAPATSAVPPGAPRDGVASLLPVAASRALQDAAIPGSQVQVIARETHFAPVMPGAGPGQAEPAQVQPTQVQPAQVEPRPARPATSPMNEAQAPELASVPGAPDPRKAGATAAFRGSPTSDSEPASEEDHTAGPDRAVEERDAAPPKPAQGRTAPIPASLPSRESAMTAVSYGQPPETGGLPAASLPLIADAIRKEVDRMVAAAPQAHVDAAAPGPADGLLRVLKIQLRPAELGLISVEMRVKDGRLEACLRASRPETADLLNKTSAALSELLGRSSCQAEVVILDRPRQQDGPVPPVAQPPLRDFDGGARHGGDGAGQAHHFERRDRDRLASREDQTDETNPSDDRRDGAHLYL
jgi:Meckel syndrome type 1 protein